MDTLYLVVPCYNEEEVLPETVKRLTEKLTHLIELEKISPDSRALFVNDGSKDETWEIIDYFCDTNPLCVGLSLTRNRGHQNALLAGLMTAMEYADMTISLDADLQDDVNAIDEFVAKYYEGSDIVYGVRSTRETDTEFKRGTAHAFYKIMTFLGVETVYDHADYRLMSKRALKALSQYSEVNLFLRGIVPLIGFKTATVEYERSDRFAGESKYPLKKMINFAVDGITSFSIKPIRFITGLGALIMGITVVVFLISLIVGIFGGGYSRFFPFDCLVGFMGSLQLIAVGVVGEYVGKNYMETKARPRYFIKDANMKNIAPDAEQ